MTYKSGNQPQERSARRDHASRPPVSASRSNRTASGKPHQLPELPYAADALQPHLSRETLEYHHGKHHRAYVEKLNELTEGTKFEGMALEDTVKKSSGAIFNNAAQAWNHAFFWRCMGPDGSRAPSGPLSKAIEGAFGSLDAFQDKFNAAAVATFGSGWVWLARDPRRGALSIVSAGNANTPLTGKRVPILTCDVWEHAYYIDYRNRRADFVKAFWKVVNWKFAETNFGSRK